MIKKENEKMIRAPNWLQIPSSLMVFLYIKITSIPPPE
jgi:hypothetical protein